MVKFTQTIFYVHDLEALIRFYDDAFGIKTKFVHESRTYAELDTEGGCLAFATEALAAMNLPKGHIPLDPEHLPFACEIVFTVDDVKQVFEHAAQAGATKVSPPERKPWGQTVAYVRDPEGILIEIASLMESES